RRRGHPSTTPGRRGKAPRLVRASGRPRCALRAGSLRKGRAPMANPPSRSVPPLTLRGVETFAVELPMTYPLGTSAATVRRAPLLLVNLTTEEGITGRTYLFCYRPSIPAAVDAVLRDAVSLVAGERATPIEISTQLNRRFALVGVSSIV